jgi:hypothetical protein
LEYSDASALHKSTKLTIDMTPEEALTKLNLINSHQATKGIRSDIESDHLESDEIICELLRSLGHEDIATAFESIEKWYA